MVSRRRVREIVGGVEARAVPQLVEISVKLIRAGFGDVVDLRRAVPPLIHGVGKRVHGHFRDGIQSQHQIRRKSAVQIGQRIVGFQAVHDVAVRKRRQPVELHVAVAVRAADEIVAAARRVDQRPGGKLQRVRQIAARIRKIFQRGRIEIRGGIRILRIDERRRAAYFHGLFCPRDLEHEINCLFLAQARGHRIIPLRLESCCFHVDRVSPGFNCGKSNLPSSSVLAVRRASLSRFVIVTIAPGMPALVASVTWPTIALVVSPCAQISAGNKKRQKAAKVTL